MTSHSGKIYIQDKTHEITEGFTICHDMQIAHTYKIHFTITLVSRKLNDKINHSQTTTSGYLA